MRAQSIHCALAAVLFATAATLAAPALAQDDTWELELPDEEADPVGEPDDPDVSVVDVPPTDPVEDLPALPDEASRRSVYERAAGDASGADDPPPEREPLGRPVRADEDPVRPDRTPTGAQPAARTTADAPPAAGSEPEPDAAAEASSASEDADADETAAEPEPAPSLATDLTPPRERVAGIDAHWSRRRELDREMDPSQARLEEESILAIKEDLLIPDLPLMGLAMVREAQGDLERGDADVALRKAGVAVQLAPSLPALEVFRARAAFAKDPGGVGTVLGAAWAGIGKSFAHLPTRRVLFGNLLSALYLGLVAAGLIFLAVLFLRRVRLFFHDFHHLFPRGVSHLQSSVLAGTLLALPLLVRAGLLITTVLVAAVIWLYVGWRERGVALATVGLVAAAPLFAGWTARDAAFWSTRAADVWTLERTGHWNGARDRVTARVELDEASFAELFALARTLKREGDVEDAGAIYERALQRDGRSAAAYNNLGVVRYAVGDLDGAKEHFQKAVSLERALAEGYHNLAKVYFRQGELGKGQEARRRAVELDRPMVERHPDADSRLNVAVADAPLPDDALVALARAEAADRGVHRQLRVQTAGILPESIDPWLPLAALGVVLLLGMGLGRLHPSESCPRCGRPVCRRCDRDASPRLCGQCVNVFERSGVVPPEVRAAKERSINRRHLWLDRISRTLGTLVPGAGQLIIDRPLRAILFLALVGIGAAGLLMRAGPFPSVTWLGPGPSWWRIGGFGLLALLAYLAALWDLFRRSD